MPSITLGLCATIVKGTPMDKEKFSQIIREHKEWLDDHTKGRQACLKDMNLIKADLSGVDLSYADLSGTFLHEAKMAGTKLISANLEGACLDGADLTKAVLDGAQMTNVVMTRQAILEGASNPPPKPRQTVSKVVPEKETKTDEAMKPPAKKQPTTLSEIVADLKNHDKDASATPEAFIASFVSFASRMEGEIAWYGQEYYRPVFSRLSPEQMTQLHEVVLRIGAAAESIYSQVREFRKKGSANEL